MQKFNQMLAIIGASLITGTAMSDVLVELYTSQGCSSCPPADVVLGELATQEGVVALAFHVDYWDNLGFPDTFGSAFNTQRQYAYARARAQRSVFTPQALVNGQSSFTGSDADGIARGISVGAGQSGYDDTIGENDDFYLVTLDPKTDGTGDVVALIAEYLPKQTVAITAGENAGRTLDYHNVVDNLQVAGRYKAGERIALSIPKVAGKGLAIFVQEDTPGRVLYAKNLQRP